jgi:hypothetical protein
VSASIRGPLGEFPATVVDCNPLSIDLISSRHLKEAERIGMTLKCTEVRGPGISLSGTVQTCREEGPGRYFVRTVFEHAGDTEKRLQTFLWDVEEAGRKRRHR